MKTGLKSNESSSLFLLLSWSLFLSHTLCTCPPGDAQVYVQSFNILFMYIYFIIIVNVALQFLGLMLCRHTEGKIELYLLITAQWLMNWLIDLNTDEVLSMFVFTPGNSYSSQRIGPLRRNS